MPKSEGGCLCRASRFHFEGPEKFAITCYCTDCQKVSGGGSLPQLGTDAANFEHSGPIKNYVKASDAGNALTFHFCGDCGSPLFKTTAKMPEMIFVYAGALDDTSGIKFNKPVFEDSRQAWDHS